jgi:hypothetical protein
VLDDGQVALGAEVRWDDNDNGRPG